MSGFAGMSAAQIRDILAQVEAEERAALTQVGLEFFTELVDKNEVKPSKSEDKDWFGFRVSGLKFTIEGTQYAASVVVTDVTQSDKARAARKAKEDAAKAEKAAQDALEKVKGNPEKYALLQATLAKAGITVSTEANAS